MSISARILFSTSLLLSACGSATTVSVLGELPENAESIVVGLEQGEHRSLHAHSASDGAFRFDLPADFDGEAPVEVTRIALLEPLGALGLETAGRLPESPEPRRALTTLTWLVTENASVVLGGANARFAEGVASAWIRDHPVPRNAACIRAIRDTPSFEGRATRDLLAVGVDQAVGLSLDEVILFRGDRSVEVHPLAPGETGRALGLGVLDRVWVATSTRAAVVDLDTGQFSEVLPLPDELLVVGIGEDPFTSDLYLLDSSARLWRRSAGQTELQLYYTVPSASVRPNLHKATARFHFLGPNRLVLGVDEVAGVVEVVDGVPRLEAGPSVGSGFGASARTADGRVFFAEAALGNLYRYEPGRLVRVAQVATRLVGLAPLDGEGRRFVYISASAIMGTVDTVLPEECPELPIGTWGGAAFLVRAGQSYLAAGDFGDRSRGFRWLDLEF